jgi:hypothetical protein
MKIGQPKKYMVEVNAETENVVKNKLQSFYRQGKRLLTIQFRKIATYPPCLAGIKRTH